MFPLLSHFAVSNNYNLESFVDIKNNAMKMAISLVSWVLFIYAIYLSYKCNKGFNFSSFLVACCCSPFYVLYRIAVPC